MPCFLRNHNHFLPGGFPYEEPAPLPKSFPAMSYSVTQQADLVLSYRLANNKPRATFPECLQDVDEYNCKRVGCHARWCINTEANYGEVQPQATRKRCGACG